jgi:hypothetical protein
VVDGLDVIDHEVIAEPPVAPVNVSTACAFPPTTLILGACGTVVTVTELLADEADDVPRALLADTVNVGDAAEAIPVTIIGEVAPDAV